MSEEMFSTRLILSDGTVLENCKCGYYNKKLGCMLFGVSFPQVFEYFSDSEKYKTIIFEMEEPYFITRIEYSGFDRIDTISQHEEYIEVLITGNDIEKKRTEIPKERPPLVTN